MHKLLSKSTNGLYYKAEYSLFTCVDDIVLIGDSRMESNLIPDIIEEKTDLTCWNAGSAGQEYPYFNCIQEALLARYTPKTVFINIESNAIQQSIRYKKVSYLRPYYSRSEAVRFALNKKSPFERFFMISQLYSFNSAFHKLLSPVLFPDVNSSKEFKGWKPRQKPLQLSYEKPIVHADFIDPINEVTKNSYITMIENYLNHGTEVVLIISPEEYNRLISTSLTISFFREYCKKKGIMFLDYSSNPTFVCNIEMFSDMFHLNREGANAFTNTVMADYLDSMISGIE
jgi:hypothetical protein